MKAIIMAGGEGKRLKPITAARRSRLVPLCGRPVMEHIILLLRRHGITDICAALKYRPDDIKNYFGSGEKLGVRLEYRVEQTALGTAGGVKTAPISTAARISSSYPATPRATSTCQSSLPSTKGAPLPRR